MLPHCLRESDRPVKFLMFRRNVLIRQQLYEQKFHFSNGMENKGIKYYNPKIREKN